MKEINNPGAWAQFGLAGVVIFALFLLLRYLITQHREERKEWREDIFKAREADLAQSNRVVDALNGLQHVIHQKK